MGRAAPYSHTLLFGTARSIGQSVPSVLLIARFATESGRVTAEYAKDSLFKPTKDLLLSVFFVDDLDQDAIVKIGLWVLKKKSEKDKGRKKWGLYGWANLSKDDICRLGLGVVSDTKDHERHANIVRWPTDHSRRMLLQQQLAALSCPVRLKPTVPYNPPWFSSAPVG